MQFLILQNFADFTIRSEFNRFALKMTSFFNCTRTSSIDADSMQVRYPKVPAQCQESK